MKTAFPNLRSPVQITLYSNIPFDNTYKHHTLISSLFTYNGTSLYTGGSSVINIPKERFINRRKPDNVNEFYYPRWTKAGEFNFNYANGLVTSVTLELTPEQTNANYMKVKCVNDEYYYFITGISQVNYDTYVLSLELDVLMTYQDEFLNGVKDMPIFTTRKHSHRYTNDGLHLHSSDFKTGESSFAGIKPVILEDFQQLHFDCNGSDNLEELKWLYICHTKSFSGSVTFGRDIGYNFKSIAHPLAMLCYPITAQEVRITDGTTTITFTRERMIEVINALIDEGGTKGSKISCYPPFDTSEIVNVTKSGNIYTITLPANTIVQDGIYGYTWSNNKTDLFIVNISNDPNIFILNEKNGDYDFDTIKLDKLTNSSVPSPLQPRFTDPKTLFNPFRKYKLSSSYSEGNEFFPELIYSDGVYKSNNFYFGGVYTSYIGDTNIFTYQKPIIDIYYKMHYNLYKENNIGLSSMVNYNVPTGTNALDVFNSTQAQSFYTSKVASGISSGLAIAGGVASIVIGSGMTVASSGALSPVGASMVAGGATSIAGGVASGVNAIKSTTAKIEDLKNTPDSINVQGGSFVSDYARYNNMPFIVVYSCTNVIKNQAEDFLYQYGYEVARDCYFNTELYYNNDLPDIVDENLIGRTLFNYVKTNEDLVNKINNDIPLIVKKKLSSIFNDGITLWSFFGSAEIWGGALVPSTIDLDDYFLKHTYDNTEYKGETY